MSDLTEQVLPPLNETTLVVCFDEELEGVSLALADLDGKVILGKDDRLFNAQIDFVHDSMYPGPIRKELHGIWKSLHKLAVDEWGL